MKDFNDFCLPPKLDEYFSGSYYEVDTEPVPHPDLYQGLKIAITELIALSDRTSTAFALPAGMAWGQLPNDPDICGRPDGCVREWDDDPTDPTDPGTPPGDGGSWPPYVPPTDGDTRCSIIDIPCNLRFLFVPKLSYQSHADYLKANALDRFPFNIGNAANVFKLFRPDGSQGLSSYCRHQFQFDTGLKVQVFEFRICESDIAMFWRDNVRQYLTFLMLILFFWSIYVRVSTS